MSQLTSPYPSITSSFFFNDTATTEIYTLSLHDALPISSPKSGSELSVWAKSLRYGIVWPMRRKLILICPRLISSHRPDRKSTRLNSSHQIISYAVFCLKKKNSNRGSRHTEIVSAVRQLR